MCIGGNIPFNKHLEIIVTHYVEMNFLFMKEKILFKRPDHVMSIN